MAKQSAEKKLSAYQAKRDFSKTDEPSGKAKAAPSKRLRFVKLAAADASLATGQVYGAASGTGQP